jgi:putative acetyltransferase
MADTSVRLVNALRDSGFARLSLVAEVSREIVGHVLFSGLLLVREGLRACAAAGHRIVVVLGHPDYYPRLGFSARLAGPLRAPFSGPAFMALELVPGVLTGVSGQVRYPRPFGLNDAS